MKEEILKPRIYSTNSTIQGDFETGWKEGIEEYKKKIKETCTNCGTLKENELSDWCSKCLEEE